MLGDLIKSIGEKATGKTDRDAIRRESQTKLFKQIQRKAFKKLKEIVTQNDVIIDTHALVQTQSGLLPGLNFDLLRYVKPDLIVVLESDPQDIIKRRNHDQGRLRNRDVNELEEIELIQSLEREATLVYSIYSAAPFRIIINKEGKISEATEEFEAAVKSL